MGSWDTAWLSWMSWCTRGISSHATKWKSLSRLGFLVLSLHHLCKSDLCLIFPGLKSPSFVLFLHYGSVCILCLRFSVHNLLHQPMSNFDPLQKYHSIVTCDTLPKQSRAQPICHTFWLTFSIHSCSLVTFPWSFPIVLEFYQIYRNVCQFFWHPHVSRNFWLSCDAQKAAFMSSIHLTTICTSMKNHEKIIF